MCNSYKSTYIFSIANQHLQTTSFHLSKTIHLHYPKLSNQLKMRLQLIYQHFNNQQHSTLPFSCHFTELCLREPAPKYIKDFGTFTLNTPANLIINRVHPLSPPKQMEYIPYLLPHNIHIQCI